MASGPLCNAVRSRASKRLSAWPSVVAFLPARARRRLAFLFSGATQRTTEYAPHVFWTFSFPPFLLSRADCHVSCLHWLCVNAVADRPMLFVFYPRHSNAFFPPVWVSSALVLQRLPLTTVVVLYIIVQYITYRSIVGWWLVPGVESPRE